MPKIWPETKRIGNFKKWHITEAKNVVKYFVGPMLMRLAVIGKDTIQFIGDKI